MGEKGLEKRFQWTKVKNQYYSAIIGKTNYIQIIQKLAFSIIVS